MCRWEDGKTLKYEKDSVSLASLGYKEGMSLTYKVWKRADYVHRC